MSCTVHSVLVIIFTLFPLLDVEENQSQSDKKDTASTRFLLLQPSAFLHSTRGPILHLFPPMLGSLQAVAYHIDCHSSPFSLFLFVACTAPLFVLLILFYLRCGTCAHSSVLRSPAEENTFIFGVDLTKGQRITLN